MNDAARTKTFEKKLHRLKKSRNFPESYRVCTHRRQPIESMLSAAAKLSMHPRDHRALAPTGVVPDKNRTPAMIPCASAPGNGLYPFDC